MDGSRRILGRQVDLLEGILKVFKENGIEIPYDQLDVHVVDGKPAENGKEA